MSSKRQWPFTAIDLPRPVSPARESVEQRIITRECVARGLKVRNLSQYRRSKVSAGIGDLFITGTSVAFWWETKSGERWEFSVSQLEFAADCVTGNQLYACGDRYALEVFLSALNIQRRA